jgi:hypothetical protein
MLLELFKWFDHTSLGEGIRGSTYWFPAIEVVHLLGLTLLYGSVLVVDMRILGFGMRKQSVATLAQQVTPYTMLAIGIMLLTGIPLFLSEALKCYDNQAFWFKMSCLAVALIFQFTVHRKVISSNQTTGLIKFGAAFSMLLWLGVGLGGRAIAFV